MATCSMPLTPPPVLNAVVQVLPLFCRNVTVPELALTRMAPGSETLLSSMTDGPKGSSWVRVG